MKARSFRYIRPSTLTQAFRILRDAGSDAVAIAGGQSLLPALNMRLSAPKLLVDIGNLEELTGQSLVGEFVRLGALTRHCELLRSDLVERHVPLLMQAAPHIGHMAIRNRGTLGGSLAYADPAAELPACAVALGATLVLGSLAGEREVKAHDFYKGLFETDLQPGELIVSVKIPLASAETTVGFAELTRRHGDFAIVGLAMVATVRRQRVDSARVVYFGCVERPRLAGSVSNAIEGLSLPLRDNGFESAVVQDLKPDDTPGLRADTKLHLAKVLTRRVLNGVLREAVA
jgi:aerobic carbon-monoxide dehydrogenase medium subunit